MRIAHIKDECAGGCDGAVWTWRRLLVWQLESVAHVGSRRKMQFSLSAVAPLRKRAEGQKDHRRDADARSAGICRGKTRRSRQRCKECQARTAAGFNMMRSHRDPFRDLATPACA